MYDEAFGQLRKIFRAVLNGVPADIHIPIMMPRNT